MSNSEINFKSINMLEFLKAYADAKKTLLSASSDSENSIFECDGQEYNVDAVESWLLDYGNGLTEEYLDNADVEFDDENETISIKYDTDEIEGYDYNQIFSFNDDGSIAEVLENKIGDNGDETEESKSTFRYNELTGETVKVYSTKEETTASIITKRTEEKFDDTIEDLLKYTDIDSSLLNEDNITENDDGSYTISDGESSYTVSITEDKDGNVLVTTTNNNTKGVKNSKFEIEDGRIKSKSFDGNNDENYEISKEYIYDDNGEIASYKYSFDEADEADETDETEEAEEAEEKQMM